MNVTWEISMIDYVVGIAVLAVVILILIFRYFFKKTDDSATVDKKFVAERWGKIEALKNFGKEMNLKLAIIEADKLLEYVLENMSIPGATMADRLRMASYKFPGLRKVWWAHKVRNCIVHEAQYMLSGGEARKVIEIFKKAFKELNCL